MDTCCTCAKLLFAPQYSESEKHLVNDRRVDCCARIICGKCIHTNKRFATYCPYCQISTTPSALPQGLREPPSYSSVSSSSSHSVATISDAPPPYTHAATDARPSIAADGKSSLAAQDEKPAQDVLHFLNHEHDNIASLSLRYGVPAPALRKANQITSDHLLSGRRNILIPGEYYKGGVSLSPRPIEGEDEELRKSKVRRFMTSCKVSDYDIALLYLEQVNYDLAAALEAYIDDERWERDNLHTKAGKTSVGQKNHRPFWRRP